MKESPLLAPRFHSFVAIVSLALVLSASRTVAEEVVANWDFSRAEIVGDTIVVPDLDEEAGDLVYKPQTSLADSGVKIEKKTAILVPVLFLSMVIYPWE
jgi:hypothetical protein